MAESPHPPKNKRVYEHFLSLRQLLTRVANSLATYISRPPYSAARQASSRSHCIFDHEITHQNSLPRCVWELLAQTAVSLRNPNHSRRLQTHSHKCRITTDVAPRRASQRRSHGGDAASTSRPPCRGSQRTTGAHVSPRLRSTASHTLMRPVWPSPVHPGWEASSGADRRRKGRMSCEKSIVSIVSGGLVDSCCMLELKV